MEAIILPDEVNIKPKGHSITDFKIEWGASCAGCWFKENNVRCDAPEAAGYMNELFRQHPESNGSCKLHIAVLK